MDTFYGNEMAQTLMDLFQNALGEAYYIENGMIQLNEELATECCDFSLKRLFSGNRDENRRHIRRIKDIFSLLGREAREIKVKILDGSLGDIALFRGRMPTQKAFEAYSMLYALRWVHYEAGLYQTLMLMAEELGLAEAKRLLKQTFEEEKGSINKIKQKLSEYDFSLIK